MWNWLAGGWMTGWWGFAVQTAFCFTIGPLVARALRPPKIKPPKPEREMLLRARGFFVRF